MRISIGERIFSVFNIFILFLLSASIILPFLHILSVSVSSNAAVTAKSVTFWPIGFYTDAYVELLTKPMFLTSLRNSIILTVAQVFLGLLINSAAAFGFSKPFYGKTLLNYIFIITMYFGGGLIPTYILIRNTLNLYNNYLALLLPGVVSVFYMIVIRSQIEALPASLSEAAEIDGANEFQLLFRIVIPSITPTLAAIGMFLALGMWNMWYSVMLYTNKQDMWTLQYMLRQIVLTKLTELSSEASSSSGAIRTAADKAASNVSSYNYQMAAIISVAAPIICIYPFIQKYFVKGILVGSVKG